MCAVSFALSLSLTCLMLWEQGRGIIHAEMPVHTPGAPDPRGLQLWVDLPKQVSITSSFGRKMCKRHFRSSKWWNLLIRNWVLTKYLLLIPMVQMDLSRSKLSAGRVMVSSLLSGLSVDVGTSMSSSTRKDYPYSRIFPLGGLRSCIVCIFHRSKRLTSANAFEQF